MITVNSISKKLSILFLLFSNPTFSQDAATVRQINDLIGPKYRFSILDTINCGFFEGGKQNNECLCFKKTDIDGDKNKEIIIVANDISGSCSFKVFCFTNNNSQLNIIDTSPSFCFNKGPNVYISDDTIILNSLIHHAGYSFIYKFNHAYRKYFLSLIKYFEVEYFHGNSVTNEEFYDIKKQRLTFKSEYESAKDFKRIRKKKKVIDRPLHEIFKIDLAHFVDPYIADDENSIYSKIFVFEGKLYDEMTNY